MFYKKRMLTIVSLVLMMTFIPTACGSAGAAAPEAENKEQPIQDAGEAKETEDADKASGADDIDDSNEVNETNETNQDGAPDVKVNPDGTFEFSGENVEMPDDMVIDILNLNRIRYTRADTYEGIDELDPATLSKGKEILRITTNEADQKEADGYASILPVDTPIYEAKDVAGCVIAEVDGEEIAYVEMMALE